MLTRMAEQDWVVALEAFRAARSRRGDKGRDDRRFLEALHYFAVHNVTWRALPAEFGNWTPPRTLCLGRLRWPGWEVGGGALGPDTNGIGSSWRAERGGDAAAAALRGPMPARGGR